MSTNTATPAIESKLASFNVEAKQSFVQKYNSKALPSDGFTIVMQSYRGDDKKGVVARPAVMIEVPVCNLAEYEWNGNKVYAALPQYAIDLLTDQLEQGRKLALKDADLNGRAVIDWQDMEPLACWQRLTAASETVRLTKELIEAWFASVESIFATRGLERAKAAGAPEGSTQEASVVAQTLAAYRGLYLLPAASVWTADRENVVTALAMLDKVETSHPVVRSLKKRMTEFLNPPKSAVSFDAL